jgi:hypothetical protein
VNNAKAELTSALRLRRRPHKSPPIMATQAD